MADVGDAILLWLGAYALHSTFFLAGVWLIERLWKRATPALLSALWRTALLAGIATATLQAIGVVNPIAGRLGVLPVLNEIAENETAASQAAITAPPQLVQPPAPYDPPAADARPLPETAAIAPATPEPAIAARITLDWPLAASILLWLWAGIVSLLALRAAFMWWAAHRELRDRQPVVQGPLFERIQALAHDIGLRRLPQVSFSEHIAGPFTLPNGEICIPVWARERLPQRQLDAMLAHEMAHVLHRDSFWLAIGMAVGAVFFFQPLNSLARRRLAHLAELSADDWAATRAGSGRPLAECISTFVDIAHARAKAIATPEFAAAMAKPKSELVQRVERLLNNRYTSGVLPMKTKLLIGAGALALAAVMPGLGAAAQDQPSRPFPLFASEPVEASEATAAPEAPQAPEAVTAPEAAPASPEAPAAPEPAQPPEPEAHETPESPAAPALDPAPAPEPGPQRSVSIRNGEDGEIFISITTGKPFDYKLTANGRGKIDLAPDGTGVSSLSSGGFLDATLDRGGVSRRVRYTSEGGAIQRQFWMGNQSRAWSGEADAFIAELMPILFRETGLNAKERVDWFLKQRGQDALFAELGLIDSDSVQTAYIGRWLDTATLSQPMFERVTALAGDQIDSDAHLQAILGKAYNTQRPSGRQLVQLLKAGKSIDSDAHAYALLNEVASDAMAAEDAAGAYFDLASAIESDAHMQAAFSKIVRSPSISDARIADIIRISGQDIDSDAHLNAVLRDAARRVGASDQLARDYINAVGAIDSDAHNMDALEVLVREARLSPASWIALIDAAARVNSDAHKSALLVFVAAHVGTSDDLARAYVGAARSIGSDSHKMAALEALSIRARLSPSNWRALIEATARIGSDAHKSALLASVARRIPRQPELISAYRAATGTIASDPHRRQAEDALPPT